MPTLEEEYDDRYEEDLPEAKAHTGRVLMSDVLKDIVPDDISPTDDVGAMAQNFTIVIMGCVTNGNESPFVGTLDSLMFQDADLELTLKVELDVGLAMVKSMPSVIGATSIGFSFIELHNGEDVTRLEPDDGFSVKGLRIEQVDHRRRMCMLLLNLQH
jgi:hypothetical protein